MTSSTLWWISSSAACHEICSNCPKPFTPTRRNGHSRRCGPCTKALISRATLVQMTPSVNGIASEPRTFLMRPASTVTVRLQVSGQSKVQTLACSSRDIRGLRAETATIDYPYVWIWRLQHPVRAGLAYHLTEMGRRHAADGENASSFGAARRRSLRSGWGNEDRWNFIHEKHQCLGYPA